MAAPHASSVLSSADSIQIKGALQYLAQWRSPQPAHSQSQSQAQSQSKSTQPLPAFDGYANLADVHAQIEADKRAAEESNKPQKNMSPPAFAPAASQFDGYANISDVHAAIAKEKQERDPAHEGKTVEGETAESAKARKAVQEAASKSRMRSATTQARDDFEQYSDYGPLPALPASTDDGEDGPDQTEQQLALAAGTAMFLANEGRGRRGTVSSAGKKSSAAELAERLRQSQDSQAPPPLVAKNALGAVRLQRKVEFCKAAGLEPLVKLVQSFQFAGDAGVSSAAMAVLNAARKDDVQPFSSTGSPRVVLTGLVNEEMEEEADAGAWPQAVSLLSGLASSSDTSARIPSRIEAALFLSSLLRSNSDNAEPFSTYYGLPSLLRDLNEAVDAASSAPSADAVLQWKFVRVLLELTAELCVPSGSRTDLISCGFVSLFGRTAVALTQIENTPDLEITMLRTSRALVTALGNAMLDDYADQVGQDLISWIVVHMDRAFSFNVPSDPTEVAIVGQKRKLAEACVICVANLANSESVDVKERIISSGCLSSIISMLDECVCVAEESVNTDIIPPSDMVPDSRSPSGEPEPPAVQKGPYESLPDPSQIHNARALACMEKRKKLTNLRVVSALAMQRGVTMALAHLLVSSDAIVSQCERLQRDESRALAALLALGRYHSPNSASATEPDDDVLLGVLMVVNNLLSVERVAVDLLGLGMKNGSGQVSVAGQLGELLFEFLKGCRHHRDPDVIREANEALAVISFARDCSPDSQSAPAGNLPRAANLRSAAAGATPADSAHGGLTGSGFGGSFLTASTANLGRASVRLESGRHIGDVPDTFEKRSRAAPLGEVTLRKLLSREECRNLLGLLSNPNSSRDALAKLTELSKDPLNRRNLRAAGGLAASVGVLHSASKSEHERILCIDLLRVIKRLSIDALAAVKAATDLSSSRFNSEDQRAALVVTAEADMRSLDHVFSVPRGIHSRLVDLLSLQRSTSFSRERISTRTELAAADAANAERLQDVHSAEVKHKLRCLSLDAIALVASVNAKHQIAFGFAAPLLVRLAGSASNSATGSGMLGGSRVNANTTVADPRSVELSRRALMAIAAVAEFNRKMQTVVRKANGINIAAGFLVPTLPVQLIAAAASAIHALCDNDTHNQERLRKCGGIVKLTSLLTGTKDPDCQVSIVAACRAAVRLSTKNQTSFRKCDAHIDVLTLLRWNVDAQKQKALITRDELILQLCGFLLEFVRDNQKSVDVLFQTGADRVLVSVLELDPESTTSQVYFAALGVAFSGIRRSHKVRRAFKKLGLPSVLERLSKAHDDAKVCSGAEKVRALLGK